MPYSGNGRIMADLVSMNWGFRVSKSRDDHNIPAFAACWIVLLDCAGGGIR